MIKNNLISLVLILTIFGVLTALGFTYLVRLQISESLIKEQARANLAIAVQTAGLLEKEINTIQEKVSLLVAFPEVKDGNSAICNKKLTEVAPYLETHIDNITRVNTQMTLDCAINQAAIGFVVPPTSDIATVITSKRPSAYLGYSGYSPVSNQEVLYLNLPVYTSRGVYAGIIGGVIYLNYIADKYLTNISLPDEAYITLIDDNGNFLYHPNMEYIGKNLNSIELSGNELTLRSFNAKAIEDSKANKTGESRYELLNKQMVSVYAPAQVFPNRTWTIVITTPVESIISKIDTKQGLGGLNLFISLSGAVVMVFILFSALVLIFVVRKINESNSLLEQKIQERTRELEHAKSTVEETVKKRTGELESLKNSLEEKVRERTTAVEERVTELEQRNKFMVDRELKMVQLKEENESLRKRLDKAN